MSEAVIIRADHIQKSYKAKGRIIEAVKGISFDLYENEIFSLLGPNGSGKTTTIKMLLSLVLPDGGSVEILSKRMPKEAKKVLGRIGVILEGSRNLYWNMSVMQNVYYFANLKGKESVQVKEPMEIWAEKLNLVNNLNTPVGKLSRGMQQKAALICSLAIKPSILILDEPLLGLDIETRLEVERIIKELKESTTVLVSSHDLRFIEKVADRIAILKEGKLIALGHASELKTNISLFQYRLTLKKKNTALEYLLGIESIHGVKLKVIQADKCSDTIELTLNEPEIVFDVMEVLKQYPVVPTEINTVGESFEEIYLRLIEKREQGEAAI